MHLILFVALSILLLNIAQVQSYRCSCSCCFGQGCSPILLSDYVDAQHCTDTSCLAACQARYYQCNVTPPNGQAIGRCLDVTTTTTSSTMIGGPYKCDCYCCNSGSYSCMPSFVGSTNAFSCQVSTCSIACTKQYPQVCVNNQFGQTQGNCSGTTTPTVPLPSGTSRCGCSCLASNGYQYYEVTTTNGCSSCYSACLSIQLQCSAHQTTYCLN